MRIEIAPSARFKSAAIFVVAGLMAFTSAHAQKRACPIRKGSPSAADAAMARGDYAKASVLYKEESGTTSPEADRAHDAWVRNLLLANSIPEAADLAKTWAEKDPKSQWAKLAVAEVQYRKAELGDAFEAMQAVLDADPCNPRARFDLSKFYELSGMYAAAKKYRDLAHVLDPVDDEIRVRWLQSLSRTARLAEVTKYLDTSKSPTADQREHLVKWQTRLSLPPGDACRITTPVASTSIPIRLIQDGERSSVSWVLDVAFNGRKRSLGLDTGASGLVLTRNAAEALQLVPHDTFESGGIGDEGSVTTYIAKVKSIKVGSLEFADCDVQVLANSPRGLGDGLIGGDVFEDFLLTLDFPGRALKLDRLPPRPGETADSNTATLTTGTSDDDHVSHDRYQDATMEKWTPILRSGHDLILPVQLNSRTARLFIIDSGASSNLISPAAAREVTKVAAGADIQMFGVSGEVKKIYTTDALTLDFAGIRQPTTGMNAIDTTKMSKSAGVEISGFLGAPTLRQLILRIDYRDNLVNFTFDPKHQRNCMVGTNLLDCY